MTRCIARSSTVTAPEAGCDVRATRIRSDVRTTRLDSEGHTWRHCRRSWSSRCTVVPGIGARPTNLRSGTVIQDAVQIRPSLRIAHPMPILPEKTTIGILMATNTKRPLPKGKRRLWLTASGCRRAHRLWILQQEIPCRERRSPRSQRDRRSVRPPLVRRHGTNRTGRMWSTVPSRRERPTKRTNRSTMHLLVSLLRLKRRQPHLLRQMLAPDLQWTPSG